MTGDSFRRKMTAFEEVNWQYDKAADLLEKAIDFRLHSPQDA